MCLVHNVKKAVKKVSEGTAGLPGKYAKLIEEAISGYREQQLTLIGGWGVKSILRPNRSSPEADHSY